MSRDLEPGGPSLTSFQRSLVRAATPAIRHSRQADFHKFIDDMLRPVQVVTDRNVRDAIDAAAARYGRPPC